MIGGNTTTTLQVLTTIENEIGGRDKKWHDVMDLTGWIDYQDGDAKSTTFNAKIQESTHVFLGDYQPIPDTLEVEGKIVKVSAENTRMVANSKRYDVLLIDDPMELHRQLEIYLKFTGGQ